MTAAAQRNAMFDVLKGLGIISVVFTHTYRGGTDPVAIFVREIAVWAVPMFFLIQGYFMGSGSSDYLKSIWKKIKKNYIPYLFWAVAYGAFFWYTVGKPFTFKDIILGKTALHLYFMFYYMLFAIFCPLLYFFPRTMRIVFLYFMLGSNLVIQVLLELSKTYHTNLLPFSGPNPFKWWGFVAIGMLVAEYPQIRDYIARHARAFAYGALAVAFIGLVEPFLNNTVAYFYNKVAVFPLAIGITLALAIYYSTENPWGKKYLAYIGERSLGVYFGHFILVDPLRNILIPDDRTLVAIIVLLTCLGVREIKERLKHYTLAQWQGEALKS